MLVKKTIRQDNHYIVSCSVLNAMFNFLYGLEHFRACYTAWANFD